MIKMDLKISMISNILKIFLILFIFMNYIGCKKTDDKIKTVIKGEIFDFYTNKYIINCDINLFYHVIDPSNPQLRGPDILSNNPYRKIPIIHYGEFYYETYDFGKNDQIFALINDSLISTNYYVISSGEINNVIFYTKPWRLVNIKIIQQTASNNIASLFLQLGNSYNQLSIFPSGTKDTILNLKALPDTKLKIDYNYRDITSNTLHSDTISIFITNTDTNKIEIKY